MKDFQMDCVNIETDVLIIGAGPSGMWTAKHLKELKPGLQVTVVDKAGEMCIRDRRWTIPDYIYPIR